jgi:hypothetical protein
MAVKANVEVEAVTVLVAVRLVSVVAVMAAMGVVVLKNKNQT